MISHELQHSIGEYASMSHEIRSLKKEKAQIVELIKQLIQSSQRYDWLDSRTVQTIRNCLMNGLGILGQWEATEATLYKRTQDLKESGLLNCEIEDIQAHLKAIRKERASIRNKTDRYYKRFMRDVFGHNLKVSKQSKQQESQVSSRSEPHTTLTLLSETEHHGAYRSC